VASKARFGRLPRQSPSLTSTIVALAQEYQRVRESNIVDAWKNGGEFEGKPVHDEDIMKWFKARRDEISPGDPKWDYYDNQVREYQFAIANSKMELEYKRGKASNTEMANFYHLWAGKLPVDSEAYREREKLAAGYTDRANSGAAGGRRAAQDKAYANAINGDYKKEFAYDATLTFLESEAVNRGILNDGETLGNIDPNTADGHAINALWDEISTSPNYAKDRAFFTKQIKAHGDPNFNGDFSKAAFQGMQRTKKGATQNRLDTAKKAGRKGDVTAFGKDVDRVRGAEILVGGFDATQAYEDAHAAWMATFHDDPNATTIQIDNANKKYVGELTKIRDTLRSHLKPGERDPHLGAVEDELKTMAGDEHPYLHWEGMFGPLGNEGGSGATETAQNVKRNTADLQRLSMRDPLTGKPLFVQMKVDKDGNAAATTVKNHNNAPWGVVSVDDLDPDTIYLVQDDHGDPRSGQVITAVKAQPIMVASEVTDPTTGAKTVKQGEAPAAWNYVLPDGTEGYKYVDAGGNTIFTPDNPFGTKAADGTVTKYPPVYGPKGGEVTIPPGAPETTRAVLPEYYNPSQNSAMTARLGKSGYSMWLIASNPKNNAAYTMDNRAIVTSLTLESGGDPKVLAVKVADADGQRAIYLGNSSEEKNRIRNNVLTGTPSPVPLASLMPEGTSAEGALVKTLQGGGRDQIVEDIREENRFGGAKPLSTAGRGDPDLDGRKFGMITPPPSPISPAAVAPTAIGGTFAADIANRLTGIIGSVTKVGGPIVAGPPTTMAPVGGAPKARAQYGPTTAAAALAAPKPVAPKPSPVAASMSDMTKDDLITPTQAAISTYSMDGHRQVARNRSVAS
jgi:hypothetical protein